MDPPEAGPGSGVVSWGSSSVFFAFSSKSCVLTATGHPPRVPLPGEASIGLGSRVAYLPMLVGYSLSSAGRLTRGHSDMGLSC